MYDAKTPEEETFSTATIIDDGPPGKAKPL